MYGGMRWQEEGVSILGFWRIVAEKSWSRKGLFVADMGGAPESKVPLFPPSALKIVEPG